MDNYTPLSAYKSEVVGRVLSPSVLHTNEDSGVVSPEWFSAIRKRMDFRFRYGSPGKPVYSDQSWSLKPEYTIRWAATPHNVVHPEYLYRTEEGYDSSPSPASECILSFRNSGRIKCPSLNRLIELEQERLMRFSERVDKLYRRFAKRRYHLRLRKGKKRLKLEQQKEFIPPLYRPKYFDLFAGKAITDCFPDRKWQMISPNPVYHSRVKGSGLVPISIKWGMVPYDPNAWGLPLAWSGTLPLAIRGGVTGCSTIQVELHPVALITPNRPEKKVPAFDVDPYKVCCALESVAKEFKTEALSLPVALIELLRDPPNFAAFARNVYLALEAGWKFCTGVTGFVCQLSGLFLRPISHSANLSDWGRGTVRLSESLIRDFNEAAKALSGADLERKFSVNDSIRSGLTIFKEGVFTTAGNLYKFRKLLAERGQVRTYHRIFDGSTTQERKTILLEDCLGPTWNRTVWPHNWVPGSDPTVTFASSCRDFALKYSGYAKSPIGQVVQTVWNEDRLTVCCAWDVFDALGNRYIDDVVANQLGCSALGLSLDPAVIWNLCPFTFLIDWCYNVGKAHSYFYSLSAGRPSFQYYWALVSRKSVTSTRWLPTQLVGGPSEHPWHYGDESVVVSSSGTSWTTTEYTRMLIDPESYEGLGADWSLEKPSLAQTVTGLELLARFLL